MPSTSQALEWKEWRRFLNDCPRATPIGYEQPLPDGRKNYTKTAPIQLEEFAPLVASWDQPGPGTKRQENERAWKVPAAEILANGCNLDSKNPRSKEDITHLPPAQLAESILDKGRRIADVIGNVKGLLTRTK